LVALNPIRVYHLPVNKNSKPFLPLLAACAFIVWTFSNLLAGHLIGWLILLAAGALLIYFYKLVRG
jgi:hypothetical protein